MRVALEYQEEFSTPSGTAGSTDKYGLNHWAGRTPGYGTQMYNLYQYARLYKIDITIRISSTQTTAYEAVLVPAPYQSSTTFDVLRAYRARKIQSSGGAQSLNKLTLSGSYSPNKIEGIRMIQDKNTWYTLSQQGSAAPQDADTHALWWGVRPVDTSTTGSYLFVTTIRYHMEFFGLLNTVLSAQAPAKPLQNSSFSDEIWNGDVSDDDSDGTATITAPTNPSQPKALPGNSSGTKGIRQTDKLSNKKAAPKLMEKV
jgi:hypothetical protein